MINVDETKEYQEMCKALPEEIIKEFEKVIGSIDEVGSVAVLDDGEVGYIGTHITGWQVHGYDCSGEDTPVTRLYTQDHLQKIVKVKDKFGNNFYTKSRHFDFFVRGEAGYWESASYEKLWLCFVMYSNYNKKWTLNGWV